MLAISERQCLKIKQQEIYRNDGLICHFEFEPMENALTGMPINNLIKLNRVVEPVILIIHYKKLAHMAFNNATFCTALLRGTRHNVSN